MSIWATKSIAALRAEADASSETGLRRTLSASNLVFLGIGAIIGAGIFVLTGVAAALHAGPAVPISMVLVGIACTLAGLCYAEMASTVPVAGSAYTYSYATMGELVAWIIGWDLVLEYAMGAATVAVGWSGHLASLLDIFGITVVPTARCSGSAFAPAQPEFPDIHLSSTP
jgi:APA family basic amino acid/polyamine antiporter